jgi:hypothetical protein
MTIGRFRITDGDLGNSARKNSDGRGLNVNDLAEMSVAGVWRPELLSQQWSGVTTTGLRAGGHT